MKKLAALAAVLWLTAAAASDHPRVDGDLKAYDDHVAQLELDFAKLPANPHDKAWVKAKLQHMVAVDQYMRGMMEMPFKNAYSDAERSEFNARLHERWARVDGRNTEELKELLKIYPWFTIGEFDAAADHNAWLLVQHADHDREFQKKVLSVLEPLAARGESSPKLFAYLFDRVATSFQNPEGRKPQRYGTQGQCTSPGKWEPFPVEDPANLDARRAQVGLDTLADYQKMFVNICHESTEESMRRATEAAKKKDGGVTGPLAPVAFEAGKLRLGSFTYELTRNGERLGTATIEIRKHRDEFRIQFESKDVQQSWSSTFAGNFRPIAAELHMPGRKEPYHMNLRYTATEVTGSETKAAAKTAVKAKLPAQVVDQRVDWAAMMAAEITGNGVAFEVYDPSGQSVLAGIKQSAEPIDSVLGRQPAIALQYTIQKPGHPESYTVYATESVPRVMLREDMPNGLVSKLIAVED